MSKLNKNTDIGHVNMSKARPSVKTKRSGTRKNTGKRQSSASVAKIPPAVKTTRTKSSKNSGPNITRRSVIIGACGVGAVAAGGFGVKYAVDHSSKETGNNSVLEVPQDNVYISDNLEETPVDNVFKISKEIDLPEGSLAWANNSSWIAALIPTGKSKPLSTIELINKDTGKRNTILSAATNKSSGFEIFDVRANDTGIIWTEVNALSDTWSVFASKLDSSLNVTPVQIDSGDKNFDTPNIAITKNKAIWSVMPKTDGDFKGAKSLLKGVSFGDLNSVSNTNFTSNANTVDDINSTRNVLFSSQSRMLTPIYSYDKSVVVCPKAEGSSSIYQLTCVDEEGNVVDSLKLPQNMKPLEAGYGQSGFNFSFDAIYNYGDGISNLGTYTPVAKPSTTGTEAYSACKWLNFARTPSAPPCWCDQKFAVRSTTSVCVVDMSEKKYCVLDRPNASDDYGDYLASMGNVDVLVTFAKINDQKITGDTTKKTTLRIWEPV